MRKAQSGFTLVELMLVMAITGVIFGVMGVALQQVLTVPEYGNDRLTALHELQNVAHWVNLDGQAAQSAVGGDTLTLTLPDNSSITYTLDGTDLIRTAGTGERVLAKSITDIGFAVENRYVSMNITSAPAGRWEVSENETYKICLRPAGS